MVDEKGLEAEAADRIGEWVQMSGGEELVEKLLGEKIDALQYFHLSIYNDQEASLLRVPKQKQVLRIWLCSCATVISMAAGVASSMNYKIFEPVSNSTIFAVTV